MMHENLWLDGLMCVVVDDFERYGEKSILTGRETAIEGPLHSLGPQAERRNRRLAWILGCNRPSNTGNVENVVGC